MKKIITYFSVIFITILISAFYIPPRTSYYGELRAMKVMNYSDSALSSLMYQGMGFIYDSPVEDFSPANGVNNGTIKLNNRSLYFEPVIKMYLDSADRKTNQGINWSLSGSNSLPTFTYSCSNTYPAFNGVKALPNTISKSDNLTIPFNNLQGADEIEFTIDDLQLHLLAPWYRKVSATTNNIIIPKNHLQGLTCGAVTVRISFIKKEEKMFNGKMFKFEHRLNINKLVNLIS